ncbi:V-type ATP synthase subunit D [Anaerosoma tenue]|uniref:V-type ATP synthase subunit D n=1 Tax=Anaerosoma tenue TaxID=2933588 RepID=UPI00226083F3|nr:V-type ATP synthase subunit D [Anaerosoma tenue]MCK8114895.1 V-type ATP synthase subunit D [Anaerosoma tenue]
MPQIRANPNRMELLKLRRRGAVARRGHKLLKDKLDELMKEFQGRIGANRRLRAEVERDLLAAYAQFAMARAEAGQGSLETALMAGEPGPLLSVDERSLMSVSVPVFTLDDLPEPGGYSLATTPAVLDAGLSRLAEVAPRLLELAEREKAIELLAAEIERTRRRVNALEYVLIPSIDETVRSITMKLDEAERSNLTRLMKVKDMIARQETAEGL